MTSASEREPKAMESVARSMSASDNKPRSIALANNSSMDSVDSLVTPSLPQPLVGDTSPVAMARSSPAELDSASMIASFLAAM